MDLWNKWYVRYLLVLPLLLGGIFGVVAVLSGVAEGWLFLPGGAAAIWYIDKKYDKEAVG